MSDGRSTALDRAAHSTSDKGAHNAPSSTSPDYRRFEKHRSTLPIWSTGQSPRRTRPLPGTATEPTPTRRLCQDLSSPCSGRPALRQENWTTPSSFKDEIVSERRLHRTTHQKGISIAHCAIMMISLNDFSWIFSQPATSFPLFLHVTASHVILRQSNHRTDFSTCPVTSGAQPAPSTGPIGCTMKAWSWNSRATALITHCSCKRSSQVHIHFALLISSFTLYNHSPPL